MTPQEKADNLVNQYRIVLMREDTDCGNEILCSRIAKECALITIDEMLKVGYYSDDKIYDYLHTVKQEIDKL
jgi:hypothetical protein